MPDDEQTTTTTTPDSPPVTATPPVNEGGGKTFTQDEVNAIVGDRAKRAESKARQDLAEKLGFKSIKEMEEAVAAYRAAQEAQLSELDKANKRAADLEQQSKAQVEQTNARLIRAEVRAQAGQMGFRDLGDAQLADLSAVEITADGDVKGVKEALEALAAAKPYLLNGDAPRPTAPKTDGGLGNLPQSGGAVLTPGEAQLAQTAQAMGFKVDPAKVAARKAQTRTAREG